MPIPETKSVLAQWWASAPPAVQEIGAAALVCAWSLSCLGMIWAAGCRMRFIHHGNTRRSIRLAFKAVAAGALVGLFAPILGWARPGATMLSALPLMVGMTAVLWITAVQWRDGVPWVFRTEHERRRTDRRRSDATTRHATAWGGL